MANLNCDLNDIDCLISKNTSEIFNAFTAFTIPSSDGTYLYGPCREHCQSAPSVDGKILVSSLAGSPQKALSVPTL